MNQRKLRNIITVMWGLILCSNLILILWEPSYTGWACIGFIFGGLFIMLLHNPLFNIQESIIKSSNDLNEIVMKNNNILMEKLKKRGKK